MIDDRIIGSYEIWVQQVRSNNESNMNAYNSALTPTMRRGFPRIIMDDLVNVQPITSQNNIFFNMTYRYENDNMISTKKIEIFTDEDFTM